MTETLKSKLLTYGIILCVIVGLTAGIFFALPAVNAYAETEPVTGNYDEDFVVTDTANEVLAEYLYVRTSETECRVSITNKTTATKAIIPEYAEIDGQKYAVTEVAANGFTSSAKLCRVRLPATIRKIGNSAFANCAELSRITLSNVREIGSNVFFRCPKLEYLFLPKSVEVIGANILMNNNTQVFARAASAGAGWNANWNANNGIQEVEYNSVNKEPLELTTVYSDVAFFSAEQPTVIGYAVDGGQPRTDEFYNTDDDNNIFIPEYLNGVRICRIDEYAFSYNSFSQFVVEYSQEEIAISSYAFWGAEGASITVNRPVRFYDTESGGPSESVFTESTIEAIVLPNSVTEITDSMFFGCTELTNVFFEQPVDCTRNDSLNIVNNLLFAESEDGQTVRVPAVVDLPATLERIGDNAFDGTVGIAELHVYDTVRNVGASIFNGWQEGQKIVVHNDNELDGWHVDWAAGINGAEVSYTVKHYIITFRFDNGTDTVVTKKVKFGDPIGEMPIPVKEYCNFEAWADADNVVWTSAAVYSIERNLDLYACYSAFILSIGYNPNSPDANLYPVMGAMDKSYYAYDEVSHLRYNEYLINGWQFAGWSVTSGNVTVSFADQGEIDVLATFQTLSVPVTDGAEITLSAKWELEVYNIDYVYERGANPDSNPLTYTIQTDTITFAEIVLEDYDSWWEPARIPKGSYENITVTAYYSPTTKHYATFRYLDGITNTSSIVFEENEDYYLPQITRTGYHFVGWRLQGTANTFVTNLKGYEHDVTLEAVWVLTGTTYTLSSTATTLTVSAEYSTVEIPYSHSAAEIVVGTNVKQLYLYANSYMVHLVRITVQSVRTSDFSLILDNVGIQSADAAYPTVNMTDSRTLKLTAYKSCVIQGATGTRGDKGSSIDASIGIGGDGTDGGNGGVAVRCVNLTVCSPVTIVGGTGGKGGDGYSSNHGGNGGKGGSGNFAVVCSQITIQSSDIVIRGGTGGQGGHGGSGATQYDHGHGGSGGSGCGAVSASGIDFDPPQIVGRNDYSDVTFALGKGGAKGANGGELHPTTSV